MSAPPSAVQPEVAVTLAPLTAAELAEIKARIQPTEEVKLEFGDQVLDALENYAKVRVHTTGPRLTKAVEYLVDVYVPLQRDAERLLAEVELLRGILAGIICADCNPTRTLLECDDSTHDPVGVHA